jgi:hypothetical protein
MERVGPTIPAFLTAHAPWSGTCARCSTSSGSIHAGSWRTHFPASTPARSRPELTRREAGRADARGHWSWPWDQGPDRGVTRARSGAPQGTLRLMTRVAVIYYSASGNVHALAQAVADVEELVSELLISQNQYWGRHRSIVSDEPVATLDDLEWADGVSRSAARPLRNRDRRGALARNVRRPKTQPRDLQWRDLAVRPTAPTRRGLS